VRIVGFLNNDIKKIRKKERNKMKIDDRVGHIKLGSGTVVDIPSSDMVTIKWDNTPDFWYNCGVNPCTISKNELTIFSKNSWNFSTEKSANDIIDDLNRAKAKIKNNLSSNILKTIRKDTTNSNRDGFYKDHNTYENYTIQSCGFGYVYSPMVIISKPLIDKEYEKKKGEKQNEYKR
jgi:hypothetical protein